MQDIDEVKSEDGDSDDGTGSSGDGGGKLSVRMLELNVGVLSLHMHNTVPEAEEHDMATAAGAQVGVSAISVHQVSHAQLGTAT